MIRVVIVDDHRLVRDGLRRVFELATDLDVVDEAANGAEALDTIARTTPDVVSLDLSLPDIGGVELVRRLRDQHPHVRIVVLTMYPERPLAAHLFDLGIHAWLSKSASADAVIEAIRSVHEGVRVFPPSVDPRGGMRAGDAPGLPHLQLSPRELEVFLGLVEGRTPGDVANALDLSASTVSNHIASIRTKLGVETTGEILRYASRVGLIG